MKFSQLLISRDKRPVGWYTTWHPTSNSATWASVQNGLPPWLGVGRMSCNLSSRHTTQVALPGCVFATTRPTFLDANMAVFILWTEPRLSQKAAAQHPKRVSLHHNLSPKLTNTLRASNPSFRRTSPIGKSDSYVDVQKWWGTRNPMAFPANSIPQLCNPAMLPSPQRGWYFGIPNSWAGGPTRTLGAQIFGARIDFAVSSTHDKKEPPRRNYVLIMKNLASEGPLYFMPKPVSSLPHLVMPCSEITHSHPRVLTGDMQAG